MVEKISDAFRQYWIVITTVAGLCIAMAGAIYGVTSDLQRQITVNSTGLALEMDFRRRTEADRYTSADAKRDQDRIWDAITELRSRNRNSPP